MVTNSYLKAISESKSFWWNDSADYAKMDEAIENGATGVTTNPLLVKRSLYAYPDFWKPFIQDALSLEGDAKAEAIIKGITIEIAKKFQPIYEKTGGVQGYVCAQVNPKKQGDTEAMIANGKRLAAWAPNIAVKVPATSAGIRAIEDLQAAGVTTVGTVSFTVAQAVAIAAAQQRGLERCRKAGIPEGKCFSVIMVGRLDDYLRDVICDQQLPVSEEAIIHAGTACIKKAYAICRKLGYESKLMPAGMRGGYHAVDLADADMSMSLSEGIHAKLAKETAFVPHIDEPVDGKYLEELHACPEFLKAYYPALLPEKEFVAYGASQRTLSQFVDAGWGPIAEFTF